MSLKIISAGAGSGKTYRLTSEMVDYLQAGTRAEGIIATTFTKKAAAELQERVRVRLLESGMRAEAEALTNALIGTVHGLGVKLLQRFAYEAGVAPEVTIIADEDHQLLFNQALATVLSEERVSAMEQLSIQLGLADNSYYDWRREVRMLTEVARANNFSIEVLEKSKKASFTSFQELLGSEPLHTSEYYQERLLALIGDALAGIDTEVDGTKKTQQVIQRLKGMQRDIRLKARLDWQSWAKLGKLSPGAKSRDAVADLVEFAKKHYQHPGFHQDIESFIHYLFDISIDALAEYERYKKQRGLIDYTDMEVLVCQLLDHPSIQEVLSEELDLLMVDEFQDTSPIQLEIFLKLSRFAKASVWVGDPKQSIYGFRGAAPELMQAVIEKQGGIATENIQRYSWRSREDIVHMTNALFTRAFSEMDKDQVALIPRCTKVATADSKNKKDEPIDFQVALHHWHFEVEPEEGKKSTRRPGKPWMENAIANTIKTFLDRKDIHFWSRTDNSLATLQAGDVAILCRSNNKCREMADALHRAGIKAAIARAGLLQTAEAKYILACLKFLLNRNDSLSIAEILLLGESQSIEYIIQNRLEYLDSIESEKYGERWAHAQLIIAALNALRKKCIDYSSAETLDTLLEELEIRRTVASWANVQQRFDNIDRLRYFAQQYEEACDRLYTASSLGGFLLWLLELERNEQDLQASGENADAVNVLTYHKSKGLEWPMVICHDLEQSLRADVFGLEIVPESQEIEVDNILGNRWLRYWVNPYDRSLPGTHLGERLQTSEVQTLKTKQSLEEENRLLYVGITRARDYLVLPSSTMPTKWLNRVWHNGREDYPTLDPNTHESPWEWEGHFLDMQTETFVYPKQFSESDSASDKIQFWEPRAGKKDHDLFAIDPVEDWDSATLALEIGVRDQYAAPILVPDSAVNYSLAKAIKAFLAAFELDYKDGVLEDIAEGLIKRYELTDLAQPSLFLSIARQWKQYLHRPGLPTQIKKKVPLYYYHEGRQFQTFIDYLIERPGYLEVIQHSGTPADSGQLNEKVKKLGPWFFLTEKALQEQYPDQTIKLGLHFVLQGLVVPVSFGQMVK